MIYRMRFKGFESRRPRQLIRSRSFGGGATSAGVARLSPRLARVPSTPPTFARGHLSGFGWQAKGIPAINTLASFVVIMSDSIDGGGRYVAGATDLLPLDAQLNLRDVRPKEHGHRPIEHDTQASVPPGHLE